jgi:branched-chain amino acid transport system permease protein
MILRRQIPLALFACGIIACQLIFCVSSADYLLIQLTMSAYYALVVLGLCVLMGYAGQISLGHAAFFALGGYLAAVCSTNQLHELFSPAILQMFSKIGIAISANASEAAYRISAPISLFVVMVITVLLSIVIGIPVLRLKGHYLSMATLGFGIILYRIFLGTKVFGEADGISNVEPFRIFNAFSVGGDASFRIHNYYFAWILVLIALILLRNMINSRVGRGLRAIHGSEEAASAMGVDSAHYKLVVFVISAVLASIGGFFMTHYNAGIGPSEAGIMKSVRYVSIVAVGGMANLWGCLIMGVVLNFLSLRGYFGSYDDAVFGALLIAIMMFAPDGIFKKDLLEKCKNFIYGITCRFSK